MTGSLKLLMELTKFWIALTSTLSALAAFILAGGGVSWKIAAVFFGVLLTAAGACALNEAQEWRRDGRMERTRGRPIPSGRIAPGEAAGVAAALVALGSGVLLVWTNAPAAILALLAVLWYNGVYTYLKRWSAFAVVPGAVIGAIPPAIGWVAAGGRLLDPRDAVICFFFFMWQIPHFWLLLFKYGSDYERAGFPTLTALFKPDQLARITFTWIAATAVSCLLLPLFHVVGTAVVGYALAAAGMGLIAATAGLVRARVDLAGFRRAFRTINVFALAVMLCMVADPYLSR